MADYNSNSRSGRGENHRLTEPDPECDCDWPECDGAGVHRAPRDRNNLRDYFWFCLSHVRDYNKSWNYFDGMETNEYQAMARSTAKWDRPTWPIGNGPQGTMGNGPRGPIGNGPRGPAPGQQRPGLKASDQTGHIRAAAATFRVVPDPIEMTLDDYVETAARRRLPVDDRKALEVLELNATATLQDVKKRYKQLVKRFHPDANGSTNDPDNQSIRAQEELRQVIAAYSHLVKSSHLMNST